MPGNGLNAVGLAQHSNHQIDDVGTQFEHDSAGISGERSSIVLRNNIADDRINLENVPQPTLA